MSEEKKYWGYWRNTHDRERCEWSGGYSSELSALEARNRYQLMYPHETRSAVQFGKDPNPFEKKPPVAVAVAKDVAVAVDPLLVTPAERISAECDAIKSMLLEKNRKYGNSALEPQRIASRASPEEQILVRIDDKLSRWKTSAPGDDEDIVGDLIGYLIMLRVARQK